MTGMSDHHDSEVFSYERTFEQMERMLDKAERKKNYHVLQMEVYPKKSTKWIEHARNFKALEGVIKTLRWCLGDKNILHPLE